MTSSSARSRPRRRATAGVIAAAAAAMLGLVAGGAGAQDAPGGKAPAPGRVAPDVSIAGIDVGGLTARDARAEVLRTHVAPRREPIAFAIGGDVVRVNPAIAGYVADVDYALKGAMNFGRTQPLREVDVPLRERVNGRKLTRILDWHETRVAPEARDVERTFVNGEPRITKPRLGVELRQPRATRTAARAIISRNAERVALPVRRVRPDTTLDFAVVVDRDAFEARLYRAADLVRTIPVGVGMRSHPTPAGEFQVTNMERNPTWNPPDSRWAEGIGPVPPGPENPLGTRWIGISAPAIGLHGTPSPETVGERSSHGCIRMRIPHAEWLYNVVDIGTPVIVD